MARFSGASAAGAANATAATIAKNSAVEVSARGLEKESVFISVRQTFPEVGREDKRGRAEAGPDGGTDFQPRMDTDKNGRARGRGRLRRAATVWSAVTCHRFCAGDWSPSKFRARSFTRARLRWREP
ncbi:hypothetical protein LBMAG56_18150 [Verrucomicrobiota bacterium]|nr:hypothetical protein LBMAG56_18150 [Verrucomicrobiota bacterium]